VQTLWLALSILLVTALSSCKSAGGDSDLSGASSIPFGNHRFDEVTWLVSHNAFNNKKDTNWLAPNQAKNIRDQLNDGVRGLMIDLHSYKDKVYLCHNACDKSSFLTAGLNRQEPGNVFNPVVSFLRDNRNAVVTIFIEDYISKDQLRKLLDGTKDLRGLQFDPYKEDVRGRGWPKVGDMVNSNKRLLIFSDRSDKAELGVGFGPDFTTENYWSVGMVTSDYNCKSRWDNMPLNKQEGRYERLFVMNHFRDVPFTMASNIIDNKENIIMDRVEKYCLPKAGRKPNFIALDFYEYGDGRRVVERMNEVRAVIYKDGDYTGDAQLLYADQKLNAKDIKIGSDQITSLRVYPNAKIVLFDDADWNKHLMDVTTNVKNIGDANDRVSSLRVERP